MIRDEIEKTSLYLREGREVQESALACEKNGAAPVFRSPGSISLGSWKENNKWQVESSVTVHTVGKGIPPSKQSERG